MARIILNSNPVSSFGSFNRGDILGTDKYPFEFLRHLVEDCKAADWMDIETKVDDEYEAKKKPLSLPLSQPVKASRRKTLNLQKKKAK